MITWLDATVYNVSVCLEVCTEVRTDCINSNTDHRVAHLIGFQCACMCVCMLATLSGIFPNLISKGVIKIWHAITHASQWHADTLMHVCLHDTGHRCAATNMQCGWSQWLCCQKNMAAQWPCTASCNGCTVNGQPCSLHFSSSGSTCNHVFCYSN